MSKQMFEKEMWLTIAEAFATPRDERTDEQGYIACRGICHAILAIDCPWYYMYEKIDEDGAIIRNPSSRYYRFFCSYEDPANDLLRADFCYLQYYILGGK